MPGGWATPHEPTPTIDDRLHAVELENDMSRIALVCNRSIREARAMSSDDAAVYLGDALRAIEKIAGNREDADGG